MEKRILVVEDDLFLRDIYCETLKNAGYYAEFAKNGNEGLTKVLQGGWDLILLDVLLPGMTGIEIMHKVREATIAEPNKKIVFLTNMDNPKEVNEINELNLEYWKKSELTPQVLLQKIKENLK